jgi:hypothetical protein
MSATYLVQNSKTGQSDGGVEATVDVAKAFAAYLVNSGKLGAYEDCIATVASERTEQEWTGTPNKRRTLTWKKTVWETVE